MEPRRTSNDHAHTSVTEQLQLPTWITLDDAASISGVAPVELARLVRLGVVRTRIVRQDAARETVLLRSKDLVKSSVFDPRQRPSHFTPSFAVRARLAAEARARSVSRMARSSSACSS